MRNDRQNILAISMFSALIGAIAGASAVFLANKENRVRVKQAILDFEDDASMKMEAIKETMHGASVQSKKKMARNLKSLADQIEASS